MSTRYSAQVLSVSIIAGFLAMGAGPALAEGQGLDGAKALVAKHQSPGEFVAPGPAYDAKACMVGKKILVIPMTQANPFSANVANAMKAASEEIGFELRVFDNQFDVQQWIRGIELAVAEGYDLVDLSTAPIPEMLRPQIEAAREAGVKVTVSHWYDANEPVPSFVDGASLAPFSASMTLASAWTIAKTEGKANVLFVHSDEVSSGKYAKEAIETAFATYAPESRYTFLNVPLADWSTRMTQAVQSALLADPTINYVVPFYDGMSQFVLPAIDLAGRSDVKVASFNGTPFVLDMVRAGKVEMDIGESVGWIGRAALDYDMRVLCGVQANPVLNVPLHIFDASNVESAGVPATYDAGYGDAHIAGFAKLWGIAP